MHRVDTTTSMPSTYHSKYQNDRGEWKLYSNNINSREFPNLISGIFCRFPQGLFSITNTYSGVICTLEIVLLQLKKKYIQGRVRHGTGILGTGMDVSTKLPKCPVPA